MIFIYPGLYLLTIDSRSKLRGVDPLFFVNLLKKIAQNLRSKSIQKSAEKNIEPLKGYEKCSPQYQAYMRKQIAAGKVKIKTKTRNFNKIFTFSLMTFLLFSWPLLGWAIHLIQVLLCSMEPVRFSLSFLKLVKLLRNVKNNML